MNRIKWIDAAKGIGTILVTLGHFALKGELLGIVCAFHMPLFFFVAGMTFHCDENVSLYTLFRKKLKSLLPMYIVFSLLMYIYYFFRTLFLGQNIDGLWIKRFVGIFLSWSGTSYYNALWFVPCILSIYMIARVMCKNIMGKTPILQAICCSVLGFVLAYLKITLPFELHIAFVGVLFFVAGYTLRNIKLNPKKLILCYVPTILIAKWNYIVSDAWVEVSGCQYGNPILFVLAAFCGIFASMGLAKLLDNVNWICWIGENDPMSINSTN